MYQKILHFIKYNNAFTIIITMLFVGASVSFAANPDLRDNVYASSETIISIDNSLILSTNLDAFDFSLKILNVSEDTENYYATYSYRTFVIQDGTWQNVSMEKTLKVSKAALMGKDFGLHLAKELGENINYELSYLKRVQKIEQGNGESAKVVTVEYSGLIGKMLDPEEKVIEGYAPVIPEPEPEITPTVESNPQDVVVSTPPVQEPTVTPSPVPTPPTPETTATTTPDEPTETVTPPPADMVNEELVEQVVDQLLENSQQNTPAPETPPAEVVDEPTPTP